MIDKSDQVAFRLANQRKLKGLTHKQVFNDIGIHVARFETKKANLTLGTIIKLADYYGMTLETLFIGM